MTTSLAHKDVHVMKGLCGVGKCVFPSSSVAVWTVMAKNTRCVFCSLWSSNSNHQTKKCVRMCVHACTHTLRCNFSFFFLQFNEEWYTGHCSEKCECKRKHNTGVIECKDKEECGDNAVCLPNDDGNYYCQSTGAVHVSN